METNHKNRRTVDKTQTLNVNKKALTNRIHVILEWDIPYNVNVKIQC